MQNPRVRKLFSTILGVGAVAGSLVLTSCEDEFTEEDAIRAQQETLAALKDQEAKNAMDAQAMADSLERIGARVDYTVTVVAANEANTGNAGTRTSGVATLDGIDVTVTQGGKSMTVATEGGIAVFEGLKAGSAVVSVGASGEGYSSVTYSTLLGGEGDSYRSQAYSVGTLIPVFPVTKDAGATVVRGKAYAELDATNDMPEAAEGAIVQATISVAKALNPYSAANGSFGGVRNATYEGFVQTATVDENGDYELIVPTGNGDSGSGIEADIEFLPFEKDQKYVKMNDDGSLSVETKKVIFGDGGSSSHLMSDLPAVYMEIAAPDAEPKDFAVKAVLVEQTLTSGDVEMTIGGTGYKVNDEFELSAEGDNTPATITVTEVDENGMIEEYSYVQSGTYTTKPTIKAKDGVEGTGASFTFDFTNSYDVEIENAGSGYWTEPTLTIATIVDGKQDTKVSTNFDVDGESIGEKGDYITNVSSDEVPTFTIANPKVKQAMIDPRNIEVNEDGTVESVDNDYASLKFEVSRVAVSPDADPEFDGGAGYLTSPTVTFKDINGNPIEGVAGVATVEDGEITDIKITNGGSGIRANANDTDHEELDGLDFDQSSTETLKPGSTTNVMNYNYGGGAIK